MDIEERSTFGSQRATGHHVAAMSFPALANNPFKMAKPSKLPVSYMQTQGAHLTTNTLQSIHYGGTQLSATGKTAKISSFFTPETVERFIEHSTIVSSGLESG